MKAVPVIIATALYFALSFAVYGDNISGAAGDTRSISETYGSFAFDNPGRSYAPSRRQSGI
jgi:hypothetical protein